MMTILKRSKSQTVRGAKETEDESILRPAGGNKERRTSRLRKRQSLTNVSRPVPGVIHEHTAQLQPALSAGDRNQKLQMRNEATGINEGRDQVNSQTLSSRVRPSQNTAFQPTPSLLVACDWTLGSGLVANSPSEPPPLPEGSHPSDNITPKTKQPLRAYPTIPELPENAATTPELRRKKSGWKKLGNLFQRKPSKPEPQELFYRTNPGRSSFMPAARTNMVRSSSGAQARYRNIIRSPGPQHANTNDSEAITNKGSEGKDKDGSASGSKMFPGAGRQIDTSPRLDMDIPGHELERFSVMFEKLLEPKESILERRQSRAKRLQCSGKEGMAVPPFSSEHPAPHLSALKGGVPQRSATSPHLRNMPSLKAKAAKKENDSPAESASKHDHRKPIKRWKTVHSSTAPSMARNFSRPTKAPALVSLDESEDCSPTSPREIPLLPSPSIISDCTDADDIAALSQDLSISPPWQLHRDFSHEHAPNQGLPDDPLSVSSPRGVDGDKHQLYPRVRSPADLERQIVEVSVARQVSVSKARKQVEKALSSKQPLRPMVVELNKNRKSTVVLIEGGED